MDEALQKYRDHLILADQKSQEDFDKTLLTLASGGLGLSLIFVKDILNQEQPRSVAFILAGWTLLAFSLATVLLGFFLSRYAMRKAIRQIDGGAIHSEKAGGWPARFVEFFNVVGGLSFIAGVVCIVWFAYVNLGTE